MIVTESASLKALNTMSIDGQAEYLIQIDSPEDIREALVFAKDKGCSVKVLGGGSNVILSDSITGVVLQYQGDSIEVVDEDDESVTLAVEAGLNWHSFVLNTLEKGWFGLENLSYIPGNVGACPVQNIGAYGVEVKDLITHVEGVFLDSGERFRLTNTECQFAYRESIFKQELNHKTLITHVTFRLLKQANVQVGYAPLNQMAEEKGMPTPQQLSDWVIEVRKSKLPEPSELPNAGSFFKNPVVTNEFFEKLAVRFPNIPNYPAENGVKLPAGWLIDQLGLKGYSFGRVMVHKQQALVLVNQGGDGQDVLDAAKQIKQKVQDEYGIYLEQEPRVFS